MMEDAIIVHGPELPGAMPRLRPGDIVRLREAKIMAVVIEAEVVIRGTGLKWNATEGAIEQARKHAADINDLGWLPSYAITHIPGFSRPRKYAWWTLSDFLYYIPGLLHNSRFSF